MSEQGIVRTKLLTPRRIRKKLDKINEIADGRQRKRALRRFQLKVLRSIAEGRARKPRACAREALGTLDEAQAT